MFSVVSCESKLHFCQIGWALIVFCWACVLLFNLGLVHRLDNNNKKKRSEYLCNFFVKPSMPTWNDCMYRYKYMS